MKIKILKITIPYLLLAFLFIGLTSHAQEKRRIEIDYSPFLTKDEAKYPGATVLTRDDMSQVKISHAGATMWCDQAIHYSKEDFIEAYGNVHITQGDTIDMRAKYVEYSGKTQLAIARGDVVLTEPTSELTTDTLYFDRLKQQSYYQSGGKVVRDSSGTITSKMGSYYMTVKKYQFVQDVKLVNEEYTINTNQLDFYSETGHAYLFGPSTIESEESTIYCERGFYDTNNDTGYFVKNSKIDYESRIFEGDSMYFDRNRSFASATNNIKITDTINNAIITGHYAEVFRELDSVFITKRALAVTVKDQDSVYIHGDTLMVTGKPDHRITRAYYNVKLYKSDLSGKADSIHADQKTGLTQLINLKRFSKSDAFSVKRNPVLWNAGSQITGDSIHLISNPETEKLDSLKVFDNAFIISKDTIGEGYNQIKGQKLYGLFKDNEIEIIDIIKNAESIYYMRNDKGELTGIDKSKSGSIKIWIEDNTITELRKIKQIDGNVYPEEQFPQNATRFRGFDWRDEERPKSVDDLFEDDPPLNLPIIKGLEDYIPPDDFVDDSLKQRIESAKPKGKTAVNKAARNLPKPVKPSKKPKKKNKPKLLKDGLDLDSKKKKDN